MLLRVTLSGNPVRFDVAVVGLGKIGLPLAAQFAGRGLRVIGCDVHPGVVATVNSGRTHIREEAGLAEAVADGVASGRLKATEDTGAAVSEAETVVVIVPLIVDGAMNIDFSNLDAATRSIAKGLRPGSLVIYETTLPVGTTRNRFVPMLEEGSGLELGSDLFVAFSPERLYAGRIFEDLKRYPKIVGGVDAESAQRAVSFYKRGLTAEIRVLENAETAEFCKLAETTYRDVNIALANELALYGAKRNVNIREAFEAANSQPFSHLHRPSIGVGGHCIPVYPHFLLNDAREGELGLVRAGRSTNDHMVGTALKVVDQALGGLSNRRVLVLGASYREDVKELAFSTAMPLIEQLHRAGSEVLLSDPLFEPSELAGFEAQLVDLEGDGALDVDAVIVQAYHSQFRDLDWGRFTGLRIVFDGRWSVDPDRVREAGAVYRAVGSPNGTPAA